MGKSTISMAIFNSYFDITRGYSPSTAIKLPAFRGHHRLAFEHRQFRAGRDVPRTRVPMFREWPMIWVIWVVGVVVEDPEIWLVVSNMAFMFHNIWIYMGCHPSHWLIFFRGVDEPPTRNVDCRLLWDNWMNLNWGIVDNWMNQLLWDNWMYLSRVFYEFELCQIISADYENDLRNCNVVTIWPYQRLMMILLCFHVYVCISLSSPFVLWVFEEVWHLTSGCFHRVSNWYFTVTKESRQAVSENLEVSCNVGAP